VPANEFKFQSRAGFSECLDGSSFPTPTSRDARFNPVLGFLSVSTPHCVLRRILRPRFNPVLGFLSVSTRGPRVVRLDRRRVSIPCWVF